jgi:hypothetical protein
VQVVRVQAAPPIGWLAVEAGWPRVDGHESTLRCEVDPMIVAYDSVLAARLAKELLEYAKQDWSIGSIRTKEVGEQLLAAAVRIDRLEKVATAADIMQGVMERASAERDTLRAEAERLNTLGLCGANAAGVICGCSQRFVSRDEIYRCVDCGVEFHKHCAREHFAKSGNNFLLAKEDAQLEAKELRLDVRDLTAERDALRTEVERLRNRVLVPLTELEVQAALHEGRAEAMAATGDNAWTSLLKQRDEARAEVELLRRDGDATREALIIQRDAVNDDNMRLRARLARIEPVYEAAVRWRRVIATASAMDVPGAQSPVNVPHYALIDAIDAARKTEGK